MGNLVTGIGGFFFRSKNSRELGLWYEKHFGISSMQSNSVWRQEAGPTVFAPFGHDTEYFGRMDQQFMINFRVKDIEKLLAELQAEGVKIDANRMDDSIGKFAWVYDPDGNKIELWEPADESKWKEPAK
jgi:glyoxylase I family protein